MIKLSTILFLFMFFHQNNGVNILLVAFNPLDSHRNVFVPIVKGLLEKGHHVTALVSNVYRIQSQNYSEVLVDPPPTFRFRELSLSIRRDICSFYRKSFKCFIHNINDMISELKIGLTYSNFGINSKSVINFQQKSTQKFDLVISELQAQEVTYYFSIRYKCPLILISPLDIEHPIFEGLGTFSIWSHVKILSHFNDQTDNLIGRFANRLISMTYGWIRKSYQVRPIEKSLISSHLRNIGVLDIEEHVSLMMFNNLQILRGSNKRHPGVIDISGIHLKDVEPLPRNLQRFLDDAPDGVIYVNFGSFVKESMMATVHHDIFVEVFGSAKQKIVWRHDKPSTELPKNILALENIPQNDVLAHKNVVLFITNGGVSSIMESIHHAVPMIVIPFFGDQFMNAVRVKQAQIGKLVPMIELSSWMVSTYITDIIETDYYYDKIQILSDISKNKSVDPLQNTLFWIEHVIKHKGAPHLKPTTYSGAWYEYFFLDFICMVVVFYKLLKFVYKNTFGIWLFENKGIFRFLALRKQKVD